jgi:type II secretory pathway pseudopilin PulG
MSKDKQAFRAAAAGFTLMEVTLAIGIFMMMALLFSAVVPTIARSAQASNTATQAAELAAHKMDELRSAGFSRLDLSDLASSGIGAIDQPQPSGYPVVSGSASTYVFTSVDNLNSVFPSGSTGTVTIAPDTNAPAGKVDDITVTITWASSGYVGGSYTTRTKIANLISQ